VRMLPSKRASSAPSANSSAVMKLNPLPARFLTVGGSLRSKIKQLSADR
jgi:hypothetical protein